MMLEDIISPDLLFPNQIFFDPKPEFIKFLISYAGFRTVIDCGAGVGRLERLLSEAGSRAVSVDLFRRDEPEAPVLVGVDSARLFFPKDTIAVIARPNRGDWVLDTIENATSQGIEVLYIGLEKHFEDDLDFENYQIESIFKDAGLDGEEVFSIKGKCYE